MKKLLKGITAAGLSLSMLTGSSLQMFAEDSADNYKTTEGVRIVTTEVDPTDPYNVDHNVVITIPEGFKGNVIRINPLQNIPVVSAEPGDKMNINFKVINESGVDYYYANESLQAFIPAQNLDQPRETVFRSINKALDDLGVDTRSESALSDASVGAKLKVKGYGTEGQSDAEICIDYLDDYYLDYYNTTFDRKGDPTAATLEETNLDYRRTLFNDSTFKGIDGNWVDVSYQYRPDTISKTRETNVEVNKLSYYHAYHDLLLLNKSSIADYLDKTTTAYQTLNSELNQNVFSTDGINLEKWVLGAAAGAYQDHDFYSGLCFTLVTDDVTVDEKISEPDLVKKITHGEKIDIDNEERPGDYATVDAEGRIGFTLTSHVGEDLAEVIKKLEAADPGADMGDPDAMYDTSGSYTFTFVDHLDDDLTLVKESIAVTVNGKPVTIPAESIVVTPVTEGKYAGRNQIRVSFDLVDLFEADFFEYEEFGKAPIVMTYSATVKNADEVVPGKMYNTAWVEYRDKQTQPDDVDVDTFGVKVFKYDQTTNKGLAGAKFDLYFVNEDGSETPVKEGVVSNAEGYVEFKGLKEGNYKLVETEAPKGYTKSEKPLTIVVNQTNDNEEYYVVTQFANVPEVHTGGTGTMLFSIGGGALLVAGAAYYMISKKRQAE